MPSRPASDSEIALGGFLALGDYTLGHLNLYIWLRRVRGA